MDREFTRRSRQILTRAELAKALCKFAGGVALFLVALKSITLAVGWSRGELQPLEVSDGLWIALLPLWIALFLRYYSVLRPACGAGQPPDDAPTGKPRA
jgi:hypothetical protein